MTLLLSCSTATGKRQARHKKNRQGKRLQRGNEYITVDADITRPGRAYHPNLLTNSVSPSLFSCDRDASLLEQTIQQHVEASKVGYRSSNSTSHPSSPVNDHRRFNLSDTSSTTSHHGQRRQNSVSSTTSRRSGGGGGRQQQQTPLEEQGFQIPSSDH